MVDQLCENQLLGPVVELFSIDTYHHKEQVPLGRKKIDVVFFPFSGDRPAIAVELKISDWRKALWQATYQLSTDGPFVYCYLAINSLTEQRGSGCSWKGTASGSSLWLRSVLPLFFSLVMWHAQSRDNKTRMVQAIVKSD